MQMTISFLLILGISLSVVATLGIHRLRDVYSRLHATSAMSTLGLISIIAASVFYFRGAPTSHNMKQVLAIFFLFITAPAGAHILSRAAIARGIPLWKKDGQKMTAVENGIIKRIKRNADTGPAPPPTHRDAPNQ